MTEITSAEKYAIGACARRVSLLPIKTVQASQDNGAYTDGQNIFLPLNDPRLTRFDQEGIAAHEGSHIRFRSIVDPTIAPTVCPENAKIGQTVLNIVEDRRIETLLSMKYHGYWASLDEFNDRMTAEHLAQMKAEVKSIEQKGEDIPKIFVLMSSIASRSESNLGILTDENGKFLYASPALSRLMVKFESAIEDMDDQLSFPSAILASKKICDALREWMNDDNKEDKQDGEGEGEGEESHDSGKGKDLKDGKAPEAPEKQTSAKATSKEKRMIDKVTSAIRSGKSAEETEEDLEDELKAAKEDMEEIVEEEDGTPSGPIEVDQSTRAIVPNKRGEIQVDQLRTASELKSTNNCGAHSPVSEFESCVSKHLGTIMTIQEKYAKIADDEELVRGHRSGLVSPRDLPQFVASHGQFTGIFQRLEEANGADVIVLIDESGSMDGTKMNAARQAAISLCKATEGTAVRIAVIGFGAVSGSWVIGEKIYKEFADPIDPERLGAIGCSCHYVQNRDGASFISAITHFDNTNTNRKYLVVISDGQPAHPSDRDSYGGEEALEECRQIVTNAERDGIQTFCLSMDFDHPSYLKDIYLAKRYFILNSAEELPTMLINLVESIVEN